MSEEVKKHAGGRPLKFKTPDEIQDKWDEYIESIAGKDTPRILAFCVYAGINKDTFQEYKNKEGFSVPIKGMLDTCEAALEAMLHDNNRRNIIGPIFALKNNFNWKDKQEIDANLTGGVTIKWEE